MHFENPRVILFDLGGVCVTLSGADTVHEWLSDRMDMSGFWKRWISSPAVRAFECGHIDAKTFAESIVAEFPIPVGPEEFLRHFASWVSALTPGICELIESLKPHYTVACLSNTNPVHWEKLSGELDIIRHFDHAFASHQTGCFKPDADAYRHVVEVLDVPADAILFLDDLEANVTAARDAGLSSLQVRDASRLRELLRENGVRI